MGLVDLFALMSAGMLVFPVAFWAVNIAGFALHVPAVLIRIGFKGLRTMVFDHANSVRMMFRRHWEIVLRKRSWKTKPQYPDTQFDRTALVSGLPTAHLRAARYGLGLVLPGLVCSAVFAAAMGIAHVLN